MASLMDILKTTNVKLKTVQREKERLKKDLGELERDEDKLSDIRAALVGLKETREKIKKGDYDPGKNDTAYFYCRSIGEEDIKRSNKPKLYEKCPDCGEKSPVLMSYEQTCDSPKRDSWTKTAFIVCICGDYHKIKQITKGDRFLGI